MSHDWFFRRHIRIPSDRIRLQTQKPRQPPREKGPRKDPRESGKALLNQLEESVRYCNRPGKIVTEDILFILRTDSAVSFKEKVLNRFGLKLSLQIDDCSAVVSTTPKPLEDFREALRKYTETSQLRSYIDQIDSISIIKLDRVSPELSEWIDSSAAPNYVEIEILPNLGEEAYASLIQNLSVFLTEHGDQIIRSRIRKEGASLRAYMKPQSAKMIIQAVDSVWQARQAPIIITEKPQAVKIKEQPSPKMPDSDATTICVLDTGVDSAQPFLKDAIIDAIDLTPDNSAQDSNGHGTFVAGLAAYGELENRTDPKPSARIISAKILGKTASQYPYLESYLETAVQRFHDYARIFSLSVMYPEFCNTSQPTDLAYTIDKLSNEHSVLFVICTGNVVNELSSLMSSLPYPSYFAQKSCKAYGGAEACTSVTVGGVAHKDTDRSIAKKGQPSPFTRRGELGERAKPDVVSAAGNLEKLSGSSDIQDNDQILGVMSLGLSPDTLAYGSGTSFAAPVVANILARLSKEYPEAEANLLKALLIHFAVRPDQHLRLNASDDLKKALYGKGIPQFDACAYSTRSCATYVLEGSLEHDEIAWIPIYVPQVMRNIYGEKIMRVTLVYNPPVDRGVLGYTLLDLDFQLYKEYKIQRKWDRSYRRLWDNVKTDVFRWQKSGWGKEWTLMIFPKVRFRNRIADLNSLSQDFALVASLEDPNKRANIYDAIINETKTKIKPLQAYIQTTRRR